MTDRPVRWAVLGTANIAMRSFLPALRAAGGEAVVVGSRDPKRAASWAAEHGVGSTATYAEALADPRVDAIYIAVPNDQHVASAAQAAATGRAVLCEKPLGLEAGEVSTLLDAVGPRAPLWEAFVFPFHPQTQLLAQLADEELGGVSDIVSEFHFTVSRPENIRLDPQRGGGALLDVGCYPIRLARLLFGAEPDRAVAVTDATPSTVDTTVGGVLTFPEDRRLILSASLRRAPSTYTRIIGPLGELRVGNPFHPAPPDGVQLWRDGEMVRRWPVAGGTAFQYAVEHIHRVLRDGAAPQHRAVDSSLGNARALDLVRAADGAPGGPPVG